MHVGGLAVAARAAGLLIVRLDRARKVVVHDEAQVVLVDAEPERVGRDHRDDLVRHERVLHCLAIGRRHLAVIEPDRIAVLELLVQPLRFLDRRDVDDAAPRRVVEDALELHVLHLLVHRAANLEAQIRTREAGDRDVRIAHAELARDVLANDVRGRGGERENRRPAEPLGDRAEHEIVGTEVVSPLAHAVRLVDDEEADLAREQPLEEVAILEALRREIEDLALAIFHALLRVARLGGGEMRVHRERIDAVRGELVLLVLHERDERADDDRQPGKHQRGKLIDDATCRCRWA